MCVCVCGARKIFLNFKCIYFLAMYWAWCVKLYCAWSSFLQNWDRRIINKIYYCYIMFIYIISEVLCVNFCWSCKALCTHYCQQDTVIKKWPLLLLLLLWHHSLHKILCWKWWNDQKQNKTKRLVIKLKHTGDRNQYLHAHFTAV